MPIFVLNVINEKFICIQKDYMVIYSINEKKNIRKIFYIILGTELIFYILGQIFFQGINYFITGEVYLISIKFNVLTILEILSASYIVLSILLLLKKDLFTYINYYILLMVLLVVNSGYITFPMTIKVLSLLQHDYIKLLLSRTFLFLLTFFIFKMSLKRYSSKFNGGCEIKIKSSNYIDAHEIHKDYYKFHINVFLPIIGLIGLVYGVKEKDKLFMALNILLILLLPITMFVGHLVGSP